MLGSGDRGSAGHQRPMEGNLSHYFTDGQGASQYMISIGKFVAWYMSMIDSLSTKRAAIYQWSSQRQFYDIFAKCLHT
jgi:hypothetical protein